MIPYMPTYSYYNIRNIRNIRSIRSICNICNIYRTLLIAVYLVGVEKLRIGHFYPYRLRYFMHFLLDKGYFMLAYRMIENHTGSNRLRWIFGCKPRVEWRRGVEWRGRLGNWCCSASTSTAPSYRSHPNNCGDANTYREWRSTESQG